MSIFGGTDRTGVRTGQKVEKPCLSHCQQPVEALIINLNTSNCNYRHALDMVQKNIHISYCIALVLGGVRTGHNFCFKILVARSRAYQTHCI